MDINPSARRYLFVALGSRKRKKYFSALIHGLSQQAQLAKPRLLDVIWALISIGHKVPSKTILIDSHIQRQLINYPFLRRYKRLKTIYTWLNYRWEAFRFKVWRRYLASLNVDVVILWNGQKQPYTTIELAASDCGLNVAFMENGLLPNTTTLDFQGVNGWNSLPRNKAFYMSLGEGVTDFSAPIIPSRALNKKRKPSSLYETVLPEQYVFIPLQVPADSQIMLQSPWIKTIPMLYDELLRARDALTARGVCLPPFVFKEHPSAAISFECLHAKHPEMIFANNNNTVELISNAEFVVTINSTAGLEAIIKEKRVLTLGLTYYNINDLVLHAQSEQQLLDKLSLMMQGWCYDPKLRFAFLSFVQNVYCVPFDWHGIAENPEPEHVRAIESRLAHEDDFSRYIA
jgi:capsular polysaccharide export protein